MSITDKARSSITKAKSDFGMTLADIAMLCEVNEGSVQRWYTTGRARVSSIQPLLDHLSNTRLTAEQTAKELVKISKYAQNPVRLTHARIRLMSGRDQLTKAFLKELADELDELGYFLITHHNRLGRAVYAVMSKLYIFGAKRGCAVTVSKGLLSDYYSGQIDDSNSDEDEF
ncbi:hypothetical protein [Photobacterium nomapromontoriensis]|uniref:hypothetical protein n=1 Tax=Photobacterium nomapromontoriensis TaxID=2910237 RepID=UPI003D0C3427